MVQTVGITKAITNLNEAHDKFNLRQTDDPEFFTEWLEDLPELTDSEKSSLNRLKSRYLYYAAGGPITEGTVNIIMLSPLVELMGLCDPPFKIQGEKFVKVEIEEGGEAESDRASVCDVQQVYSLQPSAQRTLRRDAGDEANCWLACAGINGASASTCVHSGIGNLTLLEAVYFSVK